MTPAPVRAAGLAPRREARPGSRLQASSRVQYLLGIGPSRAELYARLGITTLEQLLRHYPRAYLDARKFVKIGSLKAGELVTVVARVRSAASLRTRSGRTDFVATLD